MHYLSVSKASTLTVWRWYTGRQAYREQSVYTNNSKVHKYTIKQYTRYVHKRSEGGALTHYLVV